MNHLFMTQFLELNLYQDKEIDEPLKILDKNDFCITKLPTKHSKEAKPFNPYSLDPQNIGHN